MFQLSNQNGQEVKAKSVAVKIKTVRNEVLNEIIVSTTDGCGVV